ncbi:MAG TPA: dihydroorotase [Anaerolineae bacterium]|nr:dihydroorotase [Anaerolineae bacterium]
MVYPDLVIQSDQIVDSHGTRSGSILIQGGTIAGIVDGPFTGNAGNVINASGLVVLPGLIDSHTHMRDPGLDEAEDWTTGTRAAAGGGVTTLLEHPNTIPTTTTLEGWRVKKEIASSKAIVDFALIAGAGEGNLDQIEGLAAAGAVAFKTFTLPCTGPNLIGCTTTDDGVLYDLFAAVAKTGRPHNVHAESHPIIRHVSQKLIEQGRIAPTDHGAARPVIAEVEAFTRCMTLAGATGVRLNFVHVSSATALQYIRLYREAGFASVTVETCPHYLLLTDAQMSRVGPYAKVNPPLRSEDERTRLWQGLLDGAIDTIGSDHAPHPYAAFERGWKDIMSSPGGSPSIEWMLPALLTQVNKGLWDLPNLVRCTSENAARLYGLYPRKGALQVGSDADFVIVDMKKTRTAGQAGLHTKDPRTCRMWEGYEMIGAPVMTIRRGEIIMRDGKVLAQPGSGRFIAPSA